MAQYMFSAARNLFSSDGVSSLLDASVRPRDAAVAIPSDEMHTRVLSQRHRRGFLCWCHALAVLPAGCCQHAPPTSLVWMTVRFLERTQSIINAQAQLAQHPCLLLHSLFVKSGRRINESGTECPRFKANQLQTSSCRPENVSFCTAKRRSFVFNSSASSSLFLPGSDRSAAAAADAAAAERASRSHRWVIERCAYLCGARRLFAVWAGRGVDSQVEMDGVAEQKMDESLVLRVCGHEMPLACDKAGPPFVFHALMIMGNESRSWDSQRWFKMLSG
ncbi:hypothetical protein IWX50DRAFT_617820 [Phyllosticta citricarpa]